MSNLTRLVAIVTLVSGSAFALVSPAAAMMVDLTILGASGSIGSAYFAQVANQSTGTGLIDPFLRIQRTGTERGINSDGPYRLDEKVGTWTHSIRVSDFGSTDLNGVESIRFLLDINQANSNPLLSMNGFRVYVASSKYYNTLNQLDSNGTLLYDMGLGNSVNLNYALESGSGAGDMLAYLPKNLFTGMENKYLYLFSEFGTTGGDYASNDGFEEWARVDAPTTPIPEPTSLLLLGGGLIGTVLLRRRRSS